MWHLLLFSLALLLPALEGSPLQEEPSASSASNSNLKAARMQHSPSDFQYVSNFTKTGAWGDLADSYLCSGGSAAAVRDALQEYYPSFDVFVLLTNPEGAMHYWATSQGEGAEFHQTWDLCGFDMVVWKHEATVSGCSSAVMASAQFLIDSAARDSNEPTTIVATIDEGNIYSNKKYCSSFVC